MTTTSSDTKLVDRQPRRLKCTRNGWCLAMEENLNPEVNARAKGLSVVEVLNWSTSQYRTVGVCYKTKPSDRGVMLNVCPWCKNPILWDQVEKEETEPPGEDLSGWTFRHLPRSTAPRLLGGIDYGANGNVLMRVQDGEASRQLIWRGGHTAWSEVGQTKYYPVTLQVLYLTKGGPTRDVFEGGCLSKKRILQHAQQIAELLKIPRDFVDEIDLKKTMLLTKEQLKKGEPSGPAD